jgi:acetate kinase
MVEAILTVNAGSSSIKFALFDDDAALNRIAKGAVEGIGTAPHLHIKNAAGETIFEKYWDHGASLSHEEFLVPALDWVDTHLGRARLVAAGHRIVHGGTRFTVPARLDETALSALAELDPLAPLHELHNLAAVAAVMKLRPSLTQIGCFDTSFHRTMPALSTRFAIPRMLHDQGIRRYGFHGLSYEYIAAAFAAMAPKLAAGRVIALHLGNGASACAMRGGKSVDSSMGFTALDGLIMGTRSGTIDPGLVLYLMQTRGMSAAEITDLLYKKSGLLGMSVLSADMRILLASQAVEAAEAIASFTLAAAKQIAGLATSLDGLDAIIFTAGIGEHAPEIRAGICAWLHWLGITIDPAANAANQSLISNASSRIAVFVIPTDEEMMIARHCRKIIAGETIFV